MKVFIKNTKKNIDAAGVYNKNTKKCVVLKGSKVSERISKSPTFTGANFIENKRNQTTKDFIVTEDVCFKSCSSASNYVTGTSTNGFILWRVKDGRTLKEYLTPNNDDISK